jgi:hypothetical protein
MGREARANPIARQAKAGDLVPKVSTSKTHQQCPKCGRWCIWTDKTGKCAFC